MMHSREGQVTFVGAERLVKTTLHSSTKVGLLRNYFYMNIILTHAQLCIYILGNGMELKL